ncbi:MAG: sigma-54-dependent Fis family transcriptional regulator [Sandaracinaceae bacterium]|nr:sigma-54-dependent Fis family transcriptional regulator [Sandaracinaceae bacterium]
MTNLPAILYVDDDAPNLAVFRRAFDEQFRVLTAENGPAALEILDKENVGVVVSDQRMPQMTGVALLAEVSKRWPAVSRVLLTAYSDRDLLLDAIRQSQVHDYVLKPWDEKDLEIRLRRALDLHDLAERTRISAAEHDALMDDLREKSGYGELIGLDGDLAPLREMIARVARTDATVMIRGETGVGKELVARTLHEMSERADNPFIRVNCAAFAEGVLESELFGHEQGSFTGARGMRVGRLEQANRGTLFLDEIGDLSSDVQVKLLRVLQEREFERVGGGRTIRVDVRVISATHRPLEELVAAGKFREDLFHRLHVVPVTIPPLRERRKDLLSLVKYFLTRHANATGKKVSIAEDALTAIENYSWPGNVRELSNVIERAVVLAADGTVIGAPQLSFDFAVPVSSSGSTKAAAMTPTSVFDEIAQEEAARIREALKGARGSVAGAAQALGIPRTTLSDRIRRYGIR